MSALLSSALASSFGIKTETLEGDVVLFMLDLLKFNALLRTKCLIMVKILSNGEIVQDDDPRAQAASSRGRGAGDRPRQGYVQHADYGPEHQGGMYAPGQQISVFNSLNQRLLALGIPRFSIGQFTVEPIVSVGFLLAGIFFGLPGLIFAGLLFVVSKLSQSGGGNLFGAGGQGVQGVGGDDRRGGGGGGAGGGFGGFGGGGGHRLGRS